MQGRCCLPSLSHGRQIRRLRHRMFRQNLAFDFSTSTTFEGETSFAHKKRLDVAIIGAPNAGKSQLLNVLTGASVSAVSRKRHTTRQVGILGARTVLRDDTATQLVFVDTPGFLRVRQAKQEGLDRDLMGTATEVQHVDFSLLVVDAARKLTTNLKESLIQLMLQALQAQGRVEVSENVNTIEKSKQETVQNKFAVVLNKVDLVHPKSDLLDIAMEIGSLAEGCLQYQIIPESMVAETGELAPELLELMPTFFYISALKNDGVEDLLAFLLDKATPCESWEVDPDASTSMTPEEVVEEVIREKIYRCLHKEVPYNIKQQSRFFRAVRERETGELGVVVHQDLMVRTKSHKELVHGTLERIRETAARDLQKTLKCPVELRLHVKLVKSKQQNWSI